MSYFAIALGLTLSLNAEDIVLRDGRTFKDAKIISQTPTNVLIQYKGGASSVAKSFLPEKLLAQYPLDEKAAAAAAAEAEARRLALQPKIFPEIKLADGRVFTNAQITAQSAGAVWIYDGKKGERVDKKLLPESLRAQYPVDEKAIAKAKAEADRNLEEKAKHAKDEQTRITAVKAAAHDWADTYFRYRYPTASGYIFVISLGLEMEPPHKVSGWTNRFSVEGRCSMEYYDSPSRNFGRHTSDAFTLTLEGETLNDEEKFKVVDFSNHVAPKDHLP